MTNKIIINAKVLQQMLVDQPELEIELAKNAADQVAEAFKKKVNVPAMVNRMVDRLDEQMSYSRSPIREATRIIIEKQVNGEIQKALENNVGNLIKDAVRKSMEDHKIWIQNNLNSIIIDNVNKALRAATEAAVKGALR